MNTKVIPTILLFLLSSLVAYGQIDYDSHDNYTGDWLNNDSWVDLDPTQSWAPQTPSDPDNNILTNRNANNIDISGYITRRGDLTVEQANPVITVYDTLLVTGNVILGSGASMNVPANGLLIVTGNLTTKGSFELGNSGRVVVGRDVNVTNGNINNNQDFYVFGTTNTSGGGKIDGCDQYDPKCDVPNALDDEDDLRNNDPSLEQFLQSLNILPPVLPVELISFDATMQEEEIVLSWTTASELNNDYFEIQRSENGIDFHMIGSMDGSGTTQQMTHYSFTDGSPFRGANYYRLKQYDLDGAFEYSAPVVRFFDAEHKDLTVHPNPAIGQLHLSLSHKFINTKVHLKLYDSNGAIALEHKFAPHTFAAAIELESVKTPGFYLIHVSNGAFEEFDRVLILK
ncbi:hypothetical protein FNH22_11480 [Fulvivirga sp. M361]|uniref:T9SS type A sorting domain-containing protein n=1 Tax=Fulvivirga sp. M361 TaxID=2594266 RepID=UPI00117B771E|nr:T9SS type A sorting domain-containing protein [Fulvivirga sp. M361]TRX59137.1 hypothetical protein FNH22_11480 [Fulvivirga sp. M361]